MADTRQRFSSLDLAHRKFLVLLVALAFLVFIYPSIARDHQLGRYVLDALMLVIILGVVRAISATRRGVVVTSVLAGLTAIIRTARILDPVPPATMEMLVLYVNIAFFAYVAVLILAYVMNDEPVTTNKIHGALCVYLLLGILWAMLFAVLFLHDSSAFHFGSTFAETESSRDLFAHFMYFSYVSLTTVGYGDITPLSVEARTLATAEAVCGQLFLAVLIARLVGLHIAYSMTSVGRAK